MVYSESHLEEAVLSMLAGLGWQAVPGAVIAPGEPSAERPPAHGWQVIASITPRNRPDRQ